MDRLTPTYKRQGKASLEINQLFLHQQFAGDLSTNLRGRFAPITPAKLNRDFSQQ
jgi:hypothetical protein